METKKSLRTTLGHALLNQSESDRKVRSRAIREKLWLLPEFRRAKLVFFFVSRPEEVDTHPMIDAALAEGKRVAVPSSDLKSRALRFYEIADRRSDLVPGVYEILEPDPEKTRPVTAAEADFVVVPGLVFDRSNRRIGHGAGFYDRFLKEIRPGTPMVALAFSFQLVKEVPQEAHDVILDRVVTD